MKQNILIFIDFTRQLLRGRNMLWAMAARDLKARYVGSVFGILWALVQPILLVMIYGIIFGVFFKARPDKVYETDSFVLFLFCGLLPFQFFSQSFSKCTTSLQAGKSLVTKTVGFPSEMLPVVAVISNLIDHLISMGLLLVILVVFTARLSPFLPLLFVYMFLTAVFSVGMGWIVASIFVYLRDVREVVGLVTRAWFLLTPIFYSASRVPDWMSPIFKLNPMFIVVQGYRYLLLTRTLPPLEDLLILFVYAFIALGIGGVFFKRLKPGFSEVL